MTVFAAYIPKPMAFVESLFLLTIAFAALLGIGYRLRIPLITTAIAMVCGAVVALVPDITPLWGSDLAEYGDMAREWSSTEYSDTFFAITRYLDVGRGRMVAFGGMLTAISSCTLWFRVFGRRGVRNTPDAVRASSEPNTPNDHAV